MRIQGTEKGPGRELHTPNSKTKSPGCLVCASIARFRNFVNCVTAPGASTPYEASLNIVNGGARRRRAVVDEGILNELDTTQSKTKSGAGASPCCRPHASSKARAANERGPQYATPDPEKTTASSKQRQALAEGWWSTAATQTPRRAAFINARTTANEVAASRPDVGSSNNNADGSPHNSTATATRALAAGQALGAARPPRRRSSRRARCVALFTDAQRDAHFLYYRPPRTARGARGSPA